MHYNRLKFSLLLLLLLPTLLIANEFVKYEATPSAIKVYTTDGVHRFTPYSESIVEVFYTKQHRRQMPSLTIARKPPGIKVSNSKIIVADSRVLTEIQNTSEFLFIGFGELTIEITKDPFSIKYFNENTLLFEEDDFYIHTTHRGFRMRVEDREKFYGGGMRVTNNLDRRGNRFPLYNKPSDGYSGATNQMYYSLPIITSNKLYTVYFDNISSGYLDIAKTEDDIVEFAAEGGRTSYVIVTADSYLQLTQDLMGLIGRQPMPPLWAFGHFSSRQGYTNQDQVLKLINVYSKEEVPLDAIVFDKYWYGKDTEVSMGNLDWDLQQFPEPIAMVDTLKRNHINSVLTTEPFILKNSTNWEEVATYDILVDNLNQSRPIEFPIQYGVTGILDSFDSNATDWFWSQLKPHFINGVAGIAGDLTEPAKLPKNSKFKYGSGEELHNGYAHMLARSIYRNIRRDFPNMRPFLLMRSGFLGSQRFGVLPWSGQVARTWDGLKSQLEISLHMSMYGLSYIHSDLGGFVSIDKKVDRELYIRWLQYGVFTPIFRPHGIADNKIQPEAVFQKGAVKKAVIPYINLRYQMLPYNYTMAWRNANQGYPMIQPIINVSNVDRDFENSQTYLWGDAFLINPIVEAKQKMVSIQLPRGYWYDYFRGDLYEGPEKLEYKVKDDLPIFIKAGSIIPFAKPMMSTAEYDRNKIELHIYKDPSGEPSYGEFYEDDGLTFAAFEKGLYALFKAKFEQSGLNYSINLTMKGGGYPTMPTSKIVELVIINFENKGLQSVVVRENAIEGLKNQKKYNELSTGYFYDKKAKKLFVKFAWNYDDMRILIKN